MFPASWIATPIRSTRPLKHTTRERKLLACSTYLTHYGPFTKRSSAGAIARPGASLEEPCMVHPGDGLGPSGRPIPTDLQSMLMSAEAAYCLGVSKRTPFGTVMRYGYEPAPGPRARRGRPE